MDEIEALKNALLPEDGASQKEIFGLLGWTGKQIDLLFQIRASSSSTN